MPSCPKRIATSEKFPPANQPPAASQQRNNQKKDLILTHRRSLPFLRRLFPFFVSGSLISRCCQKKHGTQPNIKFERASLERGLLENEPVCHFVFYLIF